MINLNIWQQKLLQQITLLIILLIIIIINYDYLYLIIEYILLYIKSIFKIQLIHLDSTDVWMLPDNGGYINNMMNDPSWSKLVPSDIEISWFKVYPSDLSTLKLHYLSPLWMEHVSNHFNLSHSF